MTANFERGSAKIFQFPARGRFAVASQRDETSAAMPSHLSKVAMWDAWYHDAAIEDAARASKN